MQELDGEIITTDTQNNADDETRQQAKDAANSDDIREQVRKITLAALSQRTLDTDNIQAVVKNVLTGVTEGLGDSSENLKPQLQASLDGLDDAISKTAIAAKLATEEAMGRASKFAEEDLKNALNDFKGLESSFFDTINTVAKQSSNVVGDILNEVSEHLKNTGTSSGKEATDAVKTLSDALLNTGKDTITEFSSATQAAGNQFANIASGVLSGMADALSPGSKKH